MEKITVYAKNFNNASDTAKKVAEEHLKETDGPVQITVTKKPQVYINEYTTPNQNYLGLVFILERIDQEWEIISSYYKT